ncbi:MAG: hypothetical protein ABJD24_04425, partial [Acidimicrobiales bacterium]
MSADYADLLTNVTLRTRRSRGSVARSILAPMVGVVGFLAMWQFLVWVFDIQQFELPTPTEILRHLWSDPSFYFENARATLWEALLGFVLGLVSALIGATIMAHNRFIEQAVLPVAVLVQVTPIIAYAPAVVIWLHFGIK